MERIEVTVTVRIPNEDRLQVFSRSFESLTELQNELPALDAERWYINVVEMRP